MEVRLLESLRALFYTPFYLAIELGCYRDEGLDVRLDRPHSPREAAESLFDGRGDVTWGGPMRMMKYIDEHGPGSVIGFAEAVTRDPFYLIGREPRPDFRFADLGNLRLASVSEVPTPWLCLRDDLQRAGMDPEALDRIGDRSMAQNSQALRSGEVDVVQLFEPYVEELIHEGTGHIWYAAATRGPTSYTTLYTSREFAQNHAGTLARMTRGLYRAQSWLHAHSGREAAERVQAYFPDTAAERIEHAIERYLRSGTWGTDPRLPLEGFVRLKAALISGGFIASDIPFESCVDNRYANQAMEQRTAAP